MMQLNHSTALSFFQQNFQIKNSSISLGETRSDHHSLIHSLIHLLQLNFPRTPYCEIYTPFFSVTFWCRRFLCGVVVHCQAWLRLFSLITSSTRKAVVVVQADVPVLMIDPLLLKFPLLTHCYLTVSFDRITIFQKKKGRKLMTYQIDGKIQIF